MMSNTVTRPIEPIGHVGDNPHSFKPNKKKDKKKPKGTNKQFNEVLNKIQLTV